MGVVAEASFVTVSGQSKRLYLYHRATGKPRGAVLYVPPFAEEMNKSRRMVALHSRSLANQGFDVLLIDLLGCGDSSGDFGDATWHAWIEDLRFAVDWLSARSSAELWLWGLRAGALLAYAALPLLSAPAKLLLWQPVTSGRAHLQQFLRLKAASDMLDGGARGAVATLREQLATGRSVYVAGYNLNPGLASGIESALLLPPPPCVKALWFEVSSREAPALPPASEAIVAAWRNAGMDIRTEVCSGPAFWQTTEIEDAPNLIQASVSAMVDARGPA
jgi:uncharacterized protein